MKQFLSLALVLISTLSYCQSIKLEGVITDSKSTSLEMANVMAVNTDTKSMDSYAITNDKGKFVLNLKPNSAYSIKVSFLGMQNREIEIITSNENITVSPQKVEIS